jgi:hypothetical protein
MHFYEKVVGGKKRIIGNPNESMRGLHHIFTSDIRTRIDSVPDNDFYPLKTLLSATGSVPGWNSLQNAHKHVQGKFFYITDIVQAFRNVDLTRLASLLVFIYKYEEYKTDYSVRHIRVWHENMQEDSLYDEMLTFLKVYCGGKFGQGLAIGGPASPYLLNLYMEAFIDVHLRRLCENNGLRYTRYVDDLVFSSDCFIGRNTRRDIRNVVERSGLSVNHRKSKSLSISMGAVFVTKIGLEEKSSATEARIVFPQKKRRKLHGMLKSYLATPFQMDEPEKISGHVSEFIYYYKNVPEHTLTDAKTFALCKKFEELWKETQGNFLQD